MSDILPIICALEDCRTHQERALWLLTTDLEAFLLCEPSIRRALREAGFLAGVEYLEAELAALRQPRRPNGHHFNSYTLDAARGRMEALSRGLPPRGL